MRSAKRGRQRTITDSERDTLFLLLLNVNDEVGPWRQVNVDPGADVGLAACEIVDLLSDGAILLPDIRGSPFGPLRVVKGKTWCMFNGRRVYKHVSLKATVPNVLPAGLPSELDVELMSERLEELFEQHPQLKPPVPRAEAARGPAAKRVARDDARSVQTPVLPLTSALPPPPGSAVSTSSSSSATTAITTTSLAPATRVSHQSGAAAAGRAVGRKLGFAYPMHPNLRKRLHWHFRYYIWASKMNAARGYANNQWTKADRIAIAKSSKLRAFDRAGEVIARFIAWKLRHRDWNDFDVDVHGVITPHAAAEGS